MLPAVVRVQMLLLNPSGLPQPVRPDAACRTRRAMIRSASPVYAYMIPIVRCDQAKAKRALLRGRSRSCRSCLPFLPSNGMRRFNCAEK